MIVRVYIDYVPAPLGCDTQITINLNITYGSRDTIQTSECNEYISPSGNQIWTQSGTYVDYVPNGANCDSIILVDLTIYPLELSLVKQGASLTALATPATYQWLDCNANFIPIPGATSQTYTSNVPGAFAVIIGKNGCQDTSVCYTITQENVGLLEHEKLNFNAFPNPNSGKFFLSGENLQEVEDLRLFSIDGKECNLDWEISDELITLRAIPTKGYYLLQIKMLSGELATIRLLIH